jgi:hypothetical protein
MCEDCRDRWPYGDALECERNETDLRRPCVTLELKDRMLPSLVWVWVCEMECCLPLAGSLEGSLSRSGNMP